MEINVPKEGITGLFSKLSEKIFKENSTNNEHEFFKVRFNKPISRQLRNIVYCGLLSREKYGLQSTVAEEDKDFTVKDRLCVLGYNFKARGLLNKSSKLEKMVSELDFTSYNSSSFTDHLDVIHEVEAVLKVLLALSNNPKMMTQDPCEVWRKRDSHSQIVTAIQTDPSFYSDKPRATPTMSQFHLDYQYYPSEIFETVPCFGVPSKGFEKEDMSLSLDIFNQEPGSCGLTKWFGVQRNKDSFRKKTRTTLFNALIHSQTSDLEVKLSLPDLPLHSDLRLRSKSLETSMISEDEGFAEVCDESEPSRTPGDDIGVQSLELWDEALKQKPLCFFTWEGRKKIIGLKSCKPFFTEAGPQVLDCLYDMRMKEASYLINTASASFKYLEMNELLRDGLMVLIGVPSQTFELKKSTSSFLVSPRVRLSGCSPESLHESLQDLAELGTNYRRLSKFTLCQKQSTMIQSSVLRAFIAGLRMYLQKYRETVIMVEASHVQSVLDLFMKFRKQAHELKFLSDICMCSQGFAGEVGKPKPKFPVGVKLLSYLYQLCLINISSPVANLLLFLLKVSCAPYLRFVQQWMFKGRCIDVYKEFMINENYTYLSHRDKHYWTNGYTMASKNKMEGVPIFLRDLADDMFTCGKSINLLKLCFPTHYVCNHEVGVPVMHVVYSVNYLKVICESSHRYCEEMKKLEQQKKLDWQRKKSEEKSKREQILILGRDKANKALAQVRELVKKAKEALAAKKKGELDFLKQQMEDALNKKILDVEKADVEDGRIARESSLYEVTTAKLDEQLKEEAREELIRYYDEITHEAKTREDRALWLSRRHALNTKRGTFLDKEAKRLDEMRKEMSDKMDKDLQPVTPDEENIVGSGRRQWIESSNEIIENHDGVDGVYNPMNHPSQSTIQNLIYDTSAENDSQTRVSYEALTSSSSEREIEIPARHPADSSVQNLIYPSSDPDFASKVIRSTGDIESSTYSKETSDLLGSKIDPDFHVGVTPKPTRGSDPPTTIEHLMYPTNTSSKTTISSRGREPASKIESLLYPVTDKNAVTLKSSRGSEPSSTVKDLKYLSVYTSNVTPTTSRGSELPSTIEGLLYPSDGTSTTSDATSKSTRDTPSTIEHQSVTPTTSRGSEPPSTIEGLLYPSDGTSTTSDATSKSTRDTPSTIEHQSVTPTTSRGSEPPSTIEGLLYPSDGTSTTSDATSKSTRDTPSTIEHLAYPSASTSSKTTKPIRGKERPTQIKSLLYPVDDKNSATTKSSRGSERPSTIQKLLYPVPSVTQEPEKQKREPLTHEDVWLATQFESYPDNFDILDEEPFGDIFARVISDRDGLRDDCYACETESGDLGSENDACNVLCLPVILQRCVMEPLITQINVVNSAIVTYFMDDLDLVQHFETLKKFLLMEDGEFSFSLTQQLSEKVSSGVTPQQLCCISTLNSIMAQAIQSSVYACHSENTRSLSFVLKSIPDMFKRNDVGIFDFLELRYKIPWPVNIIITDNCITKYNRIFAFMLRLKRIAWVLQDIRYFLKRMDKSANNSPQLRKVHLFRHEMSHFVNDVQGYISNQILYVTWQEFLQSFDQNVRNLDDLHDCHADYLNKALFRALLNKKAAPVMKIISDLFTMVLKFRTQLVLSSWHIDPASGHLVHPSFSLLSSTHASFKESTCFLLTVISKLVTRGYQPHLEELLLRLDFNSYYGKE